MDHPKIVYAMSRCGDVSRRDPYTFAAAGVHRRSMGSTRRRRALPSPLERDLDRIRLVGLERLLAVASAGLEVLPELASVIAAASRTGAGVDALRAMAIRAVVSQALED